MSFEYRKLRGRIVEKFGTVSNFAEHIGVSIVSVSNKLRGVTQFSQNDIVLWCETLEIPLSDSGTYFFT